MDLEELHRQQMECFELAKQNFSGLQQATYREIAFDNFTIRLQYNPARIRSTNAKLDQATIQKRPCFLCPGNMPKEQEGLAYANRYHIFVNPYPIFQRHFTVPTDRHTDQRIAPHIGDFLHLAASCPDYTVFYNGPGCGASAPDHCHFQMVPRHQMPLEQDLNHPRLRNILQEGEEYRIFTLENYLREVVVLQSATSDLLVQLFLRIQERLAALAPQPDEPMTNLLCWYEKKVWTLCIFPRKLGRPKQFYATGKEQILFSPGSVDMAGLIIAPRKDDFDRYSAALLQELFEQVTLTQTQRTALIKTLKEMTI